MQPDLSPLAGSPVVSIGGILYPTGYHYRPDVIEAVKATIPIPMMAGADDAIRDTSRGKEMRQWEVVRKLRGKDYFKVQRIGDCTTFAEALAVAYLMYLQMASGAREDYPADPATEWFYWVERHLVLRDRLGRGDGGTGAAAAKAATMGVLLRKRYGDGDLDLTEYSGARARRVGTPGNTILAPLMDTADDHPVRTITQVETIRQAFDVLFNLGTLTAAANQGFSTRRDERGCVRLTSEPCPHAQGIIGFDDSGPEPMIDFQNSWPENWISGPNPRNLPPGAYSVYAGDFERAWIRRGEVWAHSGLDGWLRQQLDLSALVP